MVSTGFPRWPGDLFGIVAAELAETLVSQGDQVTVLAPAYPQVPRREEWAGVDIRRVAYAWPPALQKLAYGSGLVPNLAAKPYLGGLLPTFLCSLALASARQARRADLFHGHWLAIRKPL